MGFVIIREIKVVGHEQIGAMMKDLDHFFPFSDCKSMSRYCNDETFIIAISYFLRFL